MTERAAGLGRSSAEDEVVGLASDLIRIDTTNTGDPDTVAGERVAAEYVAEKLAEVGFETTYVESGGRGRGNVIARLPGSDSERGALLVHGHLDVVPADPRTDLALVTCTQTNQVVGYDVLGGEPVEKFRLPTVRQPNSVAVDPDSGRVFVASADGGGVQVIQP